MLKGVLTLKKLLCVLMAVCLLSLLLLAGGCAEPKVLHCDNCNKEVEVDAGSNMEEDWTVYCAECNELLFGDDPLLGGD